MKQQFYFISIALIIAVSCNKTNNRTKNPVETKIEYWNLMCDNVTYCGEIDEENKIILVRGIPNPNNIKGVSYKLSSGATIEPKLDSIEWKKSQVFNILNQSIETSYTVIIKP